MKKLIWVIVLLGAAAGGWYFWRTADPAQTEAKLTQQPTVAVAETRSIEFSVNAAGEIGPAEKVSVRPEVNGRIAEFAVDIGDVVKKGDLLFTLDDRELQIEKESQQKEIERARLQLDQAQRNYERAKRLYEEQLISKEVFEDARTTYELARNALERAQKALDMVEDRIRKTRIVAPFDCTVLTRPVSVGQAVSGSGGFNAGTEVLTIADLHHMIINAHINQADVPRVRQGQEVEIEVEAVPGLKVKGVVERIAPQATIVNNIKGFATRIRITEVDPRIRPGMTANIRIPVASASNVVAVPLAAVFTEPDPVTGQNRRYVYVKQGDRYLKREVQIGVSDYFFAEVQRGVRPGEVVATVMPEADKIAEDTTTQEINADTTSRGATPKPAIAGGRSGDRSAAGSGGPQRSG